MATIGLDKLYYAPITEDPATGDETYGTPVQLAKAISAELSVEVAEAILYADDGPSEIVKKFNPAPSPCQLMTSATLPLPPDRRKGCWAATEVLISASEDGGTPVAIGFRAAKSNGTYEYFWLYRVKFALPTTSLATKADSITFSTPSIEGTILRRNKLGLLGTHPWKAEATEGDSGLANSVIPPGTPASTNQSPRRRSKWQLRRPPPPNPSLKSQLSAQRSLPWAPARLNWCSPPGQRNSSPHATAASNTSAKPSKPPRTSKRPSVKWYG